MWFWLKVSCVVSVRVSAEAASSEDMTGVERVIVRRLSHMP